MINQKCLFVDMDSVVADWITGARTYLQQHNLDEDENGIIPPHQWNRLKEHHRFYQDLPLLAGANELMAWATQYSTDHNLHLAFLTAIPNGNDSPYAFYDKVRWAEEHFPDIPVFFGPYSSDKKVHCKPGDILIDDRIENCKDWRDAAGIAHQYTTWEKCQEWIADGLPSGAEKS